MTRLLLIQGPNMEYLGQRQPELYGTTTAAELDAILRADAADFGVELDIRYSNVEGEAISWIYEGLRAGVQGLMMNPAGWLYAGYPLRDCLRAIPIPYVEVHMTNIDRRGLHSITSETADGMIMGLGVGSYRLGLRALVDLVVAGRGA